MRGSGDGVTKERTFRGGNKLGEVTGLAFEVSKSLWSFKPAVNRFKLRAFGFFEKNFRGDEWFVRTGRTGDSFEGGRACQEW